MSGLTYTNDTSDLKVYINRIFYEGDKYYKAKVTLTNKKNGIVYETNKNYKLFKKNLGSWYELYK